MTGIKNVSGVLRSPYSPDLSQNFSIPNIEIHLKDISLHFENIQTAASDPKGYSEQLWGLRGTRLHNCVAYQVSYFEVNNMEFYFVWKKKLSKVSLIT